MNTPKVSIIVGCYNVAHFLKEGRLGDIYRQTYPNWELILVDDGSTDDTPQLLAAEAARDSRVRVLHQTNKGLGFARNAGLEIASGQYIWGFDVDDHAEPDVLEYCVTEAEKRRADVIIFGFRAITPSLGTTESVAFRERDLHSNAELRAAYPELFLKVPNGNGFFWNKFYRRSFIETHGLRFGNQRIQQDEVFNLKVCEHLEHCYVSPRVLYHYYIYHTGNTRNRFIPDRYQVYKDVFHAFRHLQHLWGLDGDPLFEAYVQHRLFGNIGDCLLRNLFHPACPWTRAEKIQHINEIMDDPEAQGAIAFCESRGLGVEARLYTAAYKSRSLFRLGALRCLFSTLRKIRHLFDGKGRA